MPSADSINKAQQKREERRAARDDHAVQAAQQATDMSALTELQARAKTDPEAAETLRSISPAKKPISKLTKAEKKVAANKAAAVQADVDARVEANIPEEALELSQYEGREVPLNVLNAIASRNDTAIRDDAREMARDVGALVYNQAVSGDSRGRHARERRMNKAIQQQREAQAATAKTA